MKFKVGDRVVTFYEKIYFDQNIIEPVGIIDKVDVQEFYLVYFTNKFSQPVAVYLFEWELDHAPSPVVWYGYPMNSRENYGVELVKKPGDEHPH